MNDQPKKILSRLRRERKLAHKSQTARFMNKLEIKCPSVDEYDWGTTPLGKHRAEKKERARFLSRRRALSMP